MKVFAWGASHDGQLGLGGIEDHCVAVPSEVKALAGRNVKEIVCGARHSVFLLEDGTVYSCGANDQGQLGHEKGQMRPEQITALETFVLTHAACGDGHNLVVTDKGQVLSWGQDDSGQCGWDNQDQDSRLKPRIVKSLSSHQITQVACGSHHSIVLSKGGKLFSWGNNSYGQLGLGKEGGWKPKPTEISSLQGLPVAQIACGGCHSFVLSVSSTIFGWGKNNFGQLGLGDTNRRIHPTLLKNLRTQKIKFIACGENHTAMLTAEGGLFTFGFGRNGQLGHNDTSNETNPKKVFDFMGVEVSQIVCGRQHSLAYTPSTGCIRAFGLGVNGQLGIGPKSQQPYLQPRLIRGQWLTYKKDNQKSGVKDGCCVCAIFSGGDQTFCLASTEQDLRPPLDFRVIPSHKRIHVIDETLINAITASDSLPVDVKYVIETTFSSISCLNASFLKSGDLHCGSSKNNHGVDLDAARESFQRLHKNSEVIKYIFEVLQRSLLSTLPKSPPDIEALRLYILLSELLFQEEYRSNFSSDAVFQLAQGLYNLPSAASKVIDAWWSSFQPRHMKKVVQLFQVGVTQRLQIFTPDSQFQQLSLKLQMTVLDKLHKVNHAQHEIIPYYLFYIPNLSDITDVKAHFFVWLQKYAGAMPDQFTFCDYPFVFNAITKIQLLHIDALLQMQFAIEDVQRRNIHSFFSPHINPISPCLVLTVSRDNIVASTISQLTKQGSADFKKPLKVVFVGEEAVDAGGVRKEFFMLIMRDILDPKYGMFKYYEESRMIWFNSRSFEDHMMFRLVGVLCGLAIYNHTIIPLPFPPLIYKKLLKCPSTLEDFKLLEPTLSKNLQELLDYELADIEDVFGLRFQITEEVFGEVHTIDLVQRGSEVEVNHKNKQKYVDGYVDFVLNTSVEEQFQAFCDGFHHVCGGRVLNFFHPQELMAMVVGDENYDWEEFQESAQYKGEFYAQHPTIKFFWEVFREMSLDEKKKFLVFLTGSDRVPIQGMKSLQPIFHPVKGGSQYFPVAHTCFNLLDMPVYSNKEELRKKLLAAIEHHEGFTLV